MLASLSGHGGVFCVCLVREVYDTLERVKSLARNIFISRISFTSQCLNKLNFIITTRAAALQ